ncbi:MAG: DUF433 domain-containing protein [Hymenobacter sp.]
MPPLNRVTASHEVMLGKPVIRGTRLTVESCCARCRRGPRPPTYSCCIRNWKLLMLAAALAYATALLAQEEIIGLAA